MTRRKGKTPVGARRNAVAAAIRARGQSPHNIWIIRPPFDDEDILLNSDVAMELFYYLEGEPRFIDINYQALRTPIGSEAPHSILDREFARATSGDGSAHKVVFCLDLPSEPSASSVDGMVRHYVSPGMLDLAVQRTENWRRIIPCIRRIRSYPTATQERLILLRFKPDQRRTLREILGTFADEHPALVIGALATVLRRRELCADLDNAPWSLNTCLWSSTS